jgi:hypothetical protein
MNLEVISTIADIVGATGVIVSLIYLSTQVRKTVQQESFQIFQAVANHYLNNLDKATATKEDAEVFRQGLNRFSELTPREQGAFHSKMHSLLHGFHGVWIGYKSGTLPEHELVAMRKFYLQLLMSPGGRQWWDAFKHIPPPHLVAYLEEEVKKADGVIMPAVKAFSWLRPDA